MKKMLFLVLAAASLLTGVSQVEEAYVKPIDPDVIVFDQLG